MMTKHILIAFMVAVLITGMTLNVSAAPTNSKEIEEMSKWLDGLTVTQNSGSSTPSTPANPSGSGTEPQTQTKTIKLLTGDELKAYTDKVYELVNKEREKAGIPTFERNSLLDQAAAVRATEVQASYDKYGTCHYRLDGENFKNIFGEFGIKVSSWGENAACKVKTPESVMDAWMKSEGHKANILKEKVTEIGIGVYQHPDGTLDWVQLFAKEK